MLSQTLKVEEKKVSLVFWFVAQEPRYGHFIFWHLGSEVRDIVKWTKCQNLGSWAINKKTKDPFVFSTLKVWESKVSLFFWYMVQGLRYWQFFLWRWHVRLLLRFKRRNGHISAPGPQIKKLRTFSFLQLLKFEKAKYPYFFFIYYSQGA